MTKDADDAFLDADFAPLEATRSAFRVHKRLLYHACEQPEAFLRPVTEDLEAFEARLVAEQSGLEREAGALYAADDVDGGRDTLTAYTERRLLDAIGLGDALVARTEAETRNRFGIRMPDTDVPEGATWRPESGPMTLRSGRTYHRCFQKGLGTYPRPHGSHASEADDELIHRILAGR